MLTTVGPFRLERGVTCLRDEDDPPLPSTDPAACRSAWHAAARSARGRAGEFVEREYPQSFHTATLTDRAGHHVLLFHAQWPLVAFVPDRRYRCTDEFLDAPGWADTLAGAGFAVLGRELLLSPFAECDSSGLSDAERRQIRYWRPSTLGAALFNTWD